MLSHESGTPAKSPQGRCLLLSAASCIGMGFWSPGSSVISRLPIPLLSAGNNEKVLEMESRDGYKTLTVKMLSASELYFKV